MYLQVQPSARQKGLVKAGGQSSIVPIIPRYPMSLGTEEIIEHRHVMQIPLQKLQPADNRERMEVLSPHPVDILVPGSVLSSKRLIDHRPQIHVYTSKSSRFRERITEPGQGDVW